MIGSTDSHTSLSTAEEDNFFGKHSGVEPEPHRWEHVVIEAPDPAFTVYGWQQAASGLAAVWATENTREAIFDAMQRKETYATTGTAHDRALLRRLGLHRRRTPPRACRPPPATRRACRWAATCPPAPERQGAELPRRGAEGPALSGNLDRIQIVKGWLDASGATQEKVYDVAWSDDRQPGADGKLPPVGNTVDVARATWTNTIGDPELITVWTDPDFDPALVGLLLRQGHRDPDPALDRLRGAALRPDDDRRRADDHPGARLHLADLVHSRRMNRVLPLAGALLLAASPPPPPPPTPATASGGGFLTRLPAPDPGWDHVAAMVAVGLWGAFLGAPAIWLLPVTFPLVMALGGALGVAGVPVPGVETGIAVSASSSASRCCWRCARRSGSPRSIVGVFAIFHGYAHGTRDAAGRQPDRLRRRLRDRHRPAAPRAASRIGLLTRSLPARSPSAASAR